MKFLFTIILVLFFTSNVEAQIVNIPDINLKNTLINSPLADLGNGYNEIADTNGDGEIQVAEAEAVLGLFIGSLSISDLEGLQYFVNLEVLNCAQNGSIAYVPSTFMPNLRELICSSNQLTSLDVSQNPFLEVLKFGFNLIDNIDVTQNNFLKELYFSGCNISELDITQCNLLEKLFCNGNQLVNIDLTQNINLNMLHCQNNILTALDVSSNVNITSLYCNDNSISNLDLNQNLLVEYIYCYKNNLSSLDISENIHVKVISSFENQLTSLNIKNGHNTTINGMLAFDNPNLACIQVDDIEYANNNPNWVKDMTANYNEGCNLSINKLELQNLLNIYPNPVTDILHIENNKNIRIDKIIVYTVLGNIVLELINSENSYFDNQLNLSNLKSDVLLIKLMTEKGTIIKKIIKE
jgi:hypothetical protein